MALKHRIDEIYTQYPFYSSRRSTAQLRREKVRINRKAVQRHLRAMGLAGIHPGPDLSKRHKEQQLFPYLLRDLTITALNTPLYHPGS